MPIRLYVTSPTPVTSAILATHPGPAVTVEDQSDNDADYDENDKRRQRAFWHSVLQRRVSRLTQSTRLCARNTQIN